MRSKLVLGEWRVVEHVGECLCRGEGFRKVVGVGKGESLGMGEEEVEVFDGEVVLWMGSWLSIHIRM